MKRNLLLLAVMVLAVFGFSSLGLADQDPNDPGVADTLYLEGYPGDDSFFPPGPFLVRMPLYITHDLTSFEDSISGMIIPLCYNHSNPIKYCSTSAYYNDLTVYPAIDFAPTKSIFCHFIEDGDTVVHNWMLDLSQKGYPYGPNIEDWDTKILDLGDQVSHFWLTLATSGSDDRRMEDGERILIATMTFVIEDSMMICVDTCFWPPVGRLKFGAGFTPTYTYVPQTWDDYLGQEEYCFPVSEPEGCCQFAGSCDMMTQSACLSAGGTWYPPPYQCSGTTCQLPAQLSFTLTFHQDSLTFSQIDTFDVVTYKGLIYNTEIGEPQVPQGDFHVAIPSEISEIVVVDSVTVAFAETDTLPGTYYLWPVQLPDTISKIGEGGTFVPPDAQTYSSSSPYPEKMVEFVDQGYLAECGIAELLGYPVQYLPAQGRLLFHDSIEFTIWYTPEGPPPRSVSKMSENTRRLLERMTKSLVINPEDVELVHLLPADYDYVVITSNALKPGFQSLVDWKTKKGIPATIVTTDLIFSGYPGVDNQEKIRNFIIDANGTWGATWFLLGGDVSVVPHRLCYCIADSYTDNIPCDLYYSCLGGNWDLDGDQIYGETTDGVDMFPDVFVGRACVESGAEVETFVNKVLTYERWPPLSNYARKMLFLAFYIGCSVNGKDTKDQLIDLIVPARFDPITKLYDGSTKQQCVDALDQGHHLINHMDHCWWDQMGLGGGGSLVRPDMDALGNGDRQSILYSIGCWPAAFDQSDCIAEHFVNNPNDGGVAFIGNSRYGFYEPYAAAPWSSRSAAFDISFFLALFPMDFYHIGQTLAVSKTVLIPTALTDGFYRWIEYALNLLGDPEMPIWTDEPAFLNVSHPIQVPAGVSSSFTVEVKDGSNSPVGDALVCVSGCGVYVTGFTNASGAFSTGLTPAVTGLMNVTVTKSNFVPYQGYAKACGGYEDIAIRDCYYDDYYIPSWDYNHNNIWELAPPDLPFWVSPDILVDVNLNHIPGEPGEENPARGFGTFPRENHLYAQVRNIGSVTATNIVVEFWWNDYSIGFPSWPWPPTHFINSYVIPSLAPGQSHMDPNLFATWFVTSAIPERTCILVRLYCSTDPIVNDDPAMDNNIGLKNFYIQNWWSVPYEDDRAVISLKTINPHTDTSDVWLSLFFEDWPPAWNVELTSSDPQFMRISDSTYVFYSMEPGGERDVTLTAIAPSGTENDTGIVHVAGTIEGNLIGGASVQVVPPTPTNVLIPNMVYERFGFGHWDYFPWDGEGQDNSIILDDACPPYYGVNPGDFFEIPIILHDFTSNVSVGGFELEVEFDYIDLTFYGAMRGALLERRVTDEDDVFWSWEYFTYRVLPCTVPGCQKYKILLFGQSDMPDGSLRRGYCLTGDGQFDGDPSTWWYVDSTEAGEEIGATLAWLKFQVANNELLRDLKLPIVFEWEHKLSDTLDEEGHYFIIQDWDCAENTMSSCDGNVLYVSNDPLQYNPDVCSDTAQNPPLTILEFVDGGVHICSPCTSYKCVRGDINLDHIPYSTADAVLFARYFVEGIHVFALDRDEQVCATDVNADGRTLMLSDLVYLIRVILQDAVAIPKLAPSSEVAKVMVSGNTITTECASPIGAILFEFDGSVDPILLAENMEMLNKDNKVLVWSRTGESIKVNTEVLRFAGEAKLVSVTAVDRDGRELSASFAGKAAPIAFALNPAYPNPFNPFTNLSFTLPEAVSYSLKIYNVAGQLVRSYEGSGSVGLNLISWDSKDNAGDEVASGIYFYKLTAGSFSATRKMVVLK